MSRCVNNNQYRSIVAVAAAIAALWVAAPAAAVPGTLLHQGRILDDDGSPLTGEHDLFFSIYSEPEGGIALWTESISAEFIHGIYSVTLGESNALGSILESDGPLFLGLSVDGGAEFLPRHPLHSVPYALRAGVLDPGTAIDVSELSIDGVIVATDALHMLGGLSCDDGQLAKWRDADNAWVCSDDQDSSVRDTDTPLTEAEVEDFVVDDGLDLHSSTTLGGDTIVSVREPDVNCVDGDAVAYDESGPGWICTASAGEGDPIYSASVAAGIDSTDVSNWNTAYGWNDHSLAGYITVDSTDTLTNKSGDISMWTNDVGYISDGNTGWDNAYGFIAADSTDTLTNKSGNISMWTNDTGYLDAEGDTLATVTGRGATTATAVTLSGGAAFPGSGVWTSSGMVGIGTSSPGFPLDISSASAGQLLNLRSAGTYGYLRFQDGSNSRGIIGYGDAGHILADALSNSLAVYANSALHLTASSSAIGGITIRPSGDVGIGTTNPNSKVEIAGTGSATRLYLTDYTSAYTNGAALHQRKARGTASAPAAVQSGDRLAHFCGDGYHGSGFAFGAYMNIEATENWSSTNRGAAISFYTVANGTSYATEKMRIQHNGNVGIGKTPSYALDVAGDIRVGTGSYGCVLDGNGTVIAGTCSSDERLKQDIRPLENTLERLKKVVPVRYRMRHVHEGENVNDEHLGVVAQNVEQSLPELVQVDEQGYKRVNYSAIPIVTLQALREQQEEIEFLQKVVAEQQDRLDATVALEERLIAQESRMARMIQHVEQMQASLRE